MIMPLSIGLLGLLLPTLYGGPVSSLSFESSCSALPYQERKPWKPTSIINATYMAVNSIEFSNTSNYFAFCRLFATAPYPTENQVMFELWLPEPGNYNDRFTAVGETTNHSFVKNLAEHQAKHSPQQVMVVWQELLKRLSSCKA